MRGGKFLKLYTSILYTHTYKFPYTLPLSFFKYIKEAVVNHGWRVAAER